ncbi:MAG: hypothetical protein IH604_06225 [Burkholderiales bacterium]|nr:hypothetical protein [Burkholderiales bacterium]
MRSHLVHIGLAAQHFFNAVLLQRTHAGGDGGFEDVAGQGLRLDLPLDGRICDEQIWVGNRNVLI